MKALMVVQSIDPRGGGKPIRTTKAAQALSALGVETAILTGDDGYRHPDNPSAPIEVVSLRSVAGRFGFPRIRIVTLRRIIRQFDVVHVMGHWSILCWFVVLACRAESIPYVLSPAGELQYIYRSIFLKRLFHLVAGRGMLRNAAGFVAIAPNEIDHLKAFGVAPRTVTTVPNGISPEDFILLGENTFRRDNGLEGKRVVMFLGRLNPVKGPDLLLDAFLNLREETPDATLVFVGPDDGAKVGLLARIAATGSEASVRFIDFLSGNARTAALVAADILVVPSRSEAMSLVVIEAGVCGTPVLLTDQCGLNVLQDQGVASVVPATREGLLQGLRDLLQLPPEALQAAGERIREHTLANFTWDQQAVRLRGLLAAAVAGNGRTYSDSQEVHG
jgi:glycosyltransferase involved in cell wall biosynthesis